MEEGVTDGQGLSTECRDLRGERGYKHRESLKTVK